MEKIKKFIGLGTGRWFALVMLAGFLAFRVIDPLPVKILRLKFFDFYQSLNPRPLSQDRPVLIVDIDEKSLKAIGQWPWSRATIARIVANTMNDGAVVFGFDMIFPETDRLQPPEGSPPGVTNDHILANVLSQTRSVLGQVNVKGEKGLAVNDENPISTFAFRGQNSKEIALAFAPRITNLIKNIPVLRDAAPGRGLFSLEPEFDNIIRRVPSVFNNGGTFLPALSLEMLRLAVGSKTFVIEAHPDDGISSVAIPGAGRIPTDGEGNIWVHFSLSDPGKYVSAIDVLKGTLPEGTFANRLVLFGTSAAGLKDIRATPVNPSTPGVEVHAQIIENILEESYLSRPGYILGGELTLILIVGILLIWLVPRVDARWTLLMFVLVVSGAMATSWYRFTVHQDLVDPLYAVLSLFLIYTFMTYQGFAREESQRRQIRSAFSHFMSPAMVERLVADPSRLSLGGEMRDMTMLFCDIRGFTSISEKLDAQSLIRLINKFLTPMTNIIMDRVGTIDKYMGDCIMAFWNAPLDDPDHGRNACISSLEMIKELGALNQRLKEEALSEGREYIPLEIGIGLNSGVVCVGNMGSEKRFDYSVLGDDVNLASRLEGQSKTYGVYIVIGESTRELAPEMAILELDLIRVKGKQIPVHIFTLLGGPDFAQNKDFIELQGTHSQMLKAYRNQDWRLAEQLRAKCVEKASRRPIDQAIDLNDLYSLYGERIETFSAEPPGADWEGVFTATSK